MPYLAEDNKGMEQLREKKLAMGHRLDDNSGYDFGIGGMSM